MTTEFKHQALAAGKWASFSLAEQLGNIGSEVNRVIRASGDSQRFESAVARTFELFYLTLSDVRWRKRLKEITRAREFFCDAIYGPSEYNVSLEDLNKYFFQFALFVQSNR